MTWGSPRFVLVPSVLASGARRTTWPHQGVSVGGTHADRWFAWRLLGSNNHELGRSAAVFDDIPDTVADAQALVTAQALGGTDVTVGIAGGQADWRWRLMRAGREVAVSSRGYLRQRECQYSAAMFCDAVARASLPVPAPPSTGSRRGTECLR